MVRTVGSGGSLSGGHGTITPAFCTFHVNGVSVSSRVIDYKYEQSYGEEIGVLQAELKRSALSLVDIDNGAQVEVWRYRSSTNTKIFDGYVTRFERQGGRLKIRCEDKLTVLKRSEVTKSYDADIDASAGKISEIFTDLVTTYGGLTADATSVQDSGTTHTLDKYVCRNASVFERCQKLAETLNWQFYYRADTDKVYFEPKGYTNTGVTLTVGSNVLNTPKWKYDATQLKNKIKLIGAQRLVETTETFDGDASETEFELDKKPHSVKVYVGAALQTGGASGATSGSYDYSVDFENKKIVFESGSVPGVGVGNVEVRYSYGIPTPVEDQNEESITAYGEHDYTETRLDIVNVTDAEEQVKELLNTYSTPFKNAVLKANLNTIGTHLRCGQQVAVVDVANAVDEELTITKMTYLYPEPLDLIQVGDKERRLEEFIGEAAERVAKLNEEMTQTQDLLLHVRHFYDALALSRYKLTVRKRGIGNTFIIGGVANSTLDGKWTLEEDGCDAWSDEFVVTY